MPVIAMLAHEGGWDEILLVAGPILLIIGLLAVVKRRVDAQMPPDANGPRPDDEPVASSCDEPTGDHGSDAGN